MNVIKNDAKYDDLGSYVSLGGGLCLKTCLGGGLCLKTYSNCLGGGLCLKTCLGGGLCEATACK